MDSGPITSWQIEGEKVEVVTDFLFLGSKISGWWPQPWNQKMIASWQESYDKPRQCVEKQRHYSADKGPYSQGYGLPSGHIQLWELDHKEGRMPKNWCLQTVVLEKILFDPMDCSLPGSSDDGILQVRILEWVAISLCRGSSQPRNRTQVSCTAGRFFTIWATREAPIMSQVLLKNKTKIEYSFSSGVRLLDG